MDVPKTLTPLELKQLARVGAAARIKELETEIASLRRAFPSLGSGQERTALASSGPAPSKPGRKAKTARRGRRSPMSAAERKAVSIRMQKYWAERRKAKEKA